MADDDDFEALCALADELEAGRSHVGAASDQKATAASANALVGGDVGTADPPGVSGGNSGDAGEDDDDFDLLLALAEEAEGGEVQQAKGTSSHPAKGPAPPVRSRSEAIQLSRAPNLADGKSGKHAAAFVGPNGVRGGTSDGAGSRRSSGARSKADGGVEAFAGIRVKGVPSIPLVVLKERLSQTMFVRLRDARSAHSTSGLDGEWSTLGVLSQRAVPKESASGRMFSVCKVSDLEGAQFSLFLFGDAHADHWRQSEGSVVAIHSAKIKRDDNGSMSLSVGEGHQLQLVGRSADFGICKGKRKDGQPCTIPVNVSKCSYCEYHVSEQYKRLQAATRPQFYDHNLSTAFAGSRQQRGMGAGGSAKRDCDDDAPIGRPLKVKRLSPDEIAERASRAKPNSNGARLLQAYGEELRAAANLDIERRAADQQRRGSGAAAVVAVGPKGSSGGDVRGGSSMVDLGQADGGAKARAMAIISQMGGVPRVDPNATARVPAPLTAARQRLSQLRAAGSRSGGGGSGGNGSGSGGGRDGKAQQARVLRPSNTALAAAAPAAGARCTRPAAAASTAAAATAKQRASKAAAASCKQSEPVSAFAQAFGAAVSAAESGAPAQSRYGSLVDDEEHERLLGVMEHLDKKDEAATKMDSVTGLPVDAFQCADCRKVTERRLPECQGHQVTRVKATKRWWACRCGYRFTTVGVKYPTRRCNKCNDAGCDFKKCSMWRGGGVQKSIGPNNLASSDKMQARGTEHAFGLNSLR